MVNTWSGFDGSVNETEDAIRSQYQGSAVAVVADEAALKVTANTGGTRSVNVAAGTSWAHGVRATFDATTVTFDAVATSGQTRWDAVVARRDWGANTVTITKVNGVASGNAPEVHPGGLNDDRGFVHDQLLALVQITYNTIVPTAVRDRRLWAHKTIHAPSLSAIPPSARLFGAEVVLTNGARYRCGLSSNLPTWALVAGGYQVATQSAVVTTASGFTAANLNNRVHYSPATGDTRLSVQLRRTGAAVAPSATGNFSPDLAVATIAAAYRPSDAVPVFGQYRAASTAWYPFSGVLSTAGVLSIYSGVGGIDMATFSGASDISVRADINFIREV